MTRVTVVRYQLGEFNAVLYNRDFTEKDKAVAVGRSIMETLTGARLAGHEFTLHDCVVIFDVDPAAAPIPDEYRPN